MEREEEEGRNEKKVSYSQERRGRRRKENDDDDAGTGIFSDRNFLWKDGRGKGKEGLARSTQSERDKGPTSLSIMPSWIELERKSEKRCGRRKKNLEQNRGMWSSLFFVVPCFALPSSAFLIM